MGGLTRRRCSLVAIGLGTVADSDSGSAKVAAGKPACYVVG
jgi:hypothetical protein